MNISKTARYALASGIIAFTHMVHAQSPAGNEKSAAAAARSANEVGISSHDGVTLSGADVIVTRNGVSEKLTKTLVLENGMSVHPDGIITTRDDHKLSLRPEQTLTFDGRFLTFPVHESESSKTTTSTETKIEPAALGKEIKTSNAAEPVSKETAEETARQEAARRARAAKEGEKSGTDTQK